MDERKEDFQIEITEIDEKLSEEIDMMMTGIPNGLGSSLLCLFGIFYIKETVVF